MTRINIYTAAADADDTPKLEGWFDPAKAVESTAEATEWNERAGHMVSLVAGGFEEHEHLYRTPGGRWVLNHWSNWAGGADTYTFVTDTEAKDWLLRNGSDGLVEKYFGENPDEAPPGRPEIGGVVSTRLGDLLPPLDKWADENDMNRAEAIREAVRRLIQA